MKRKVNAIFTVSARHQFGPHSGDGRRHLIRIGAIQLLSDGDLCRDSAVVVVAGRAITVAETLDEIVRLISV